MCNATVEHDDRPIKFCLGTSGIIVTAIVRVTNDTRQVTQVIFRKQPIWNGDREIEVSWLTAGKVWKKEITAQLSKRTLIQEIEKITQAKFLKRAKP